MISRTVNVSKDVGAELIPYLVQSACHYECTLHISDGDKKINMKSIMGMTILQLRKGGSFTLVADGVDEEKAVTEIAGCFE
ncbi:MAG: HPr family phosphocarrier protein [Lachnospiraceae bacterium]|nr:HPr family phosphocarrier protein [Lachnospiraceae bacterium]